MSLLSIDITKNKKLSLDEVKFPDLKTEPTTVIYVETPKKREFRKENNQTSETKLTIQDVDKPKLIGLAQEIVKEYNSYTREEIIERIKEITNVSQERAERGFKLILQIRAIEPTLVDRYYLTGSTPF